MHSSVDRNNSKGTYSLCDTSTTVRPEKIVNPYGSTAGANSGDFHLYRQTRAREMERMKQMTQEEQERMKDLEFQKKIQQDREEEEKRTDKKRKKRQRHKEAKLRKKMLAKAGVKLDDAEDENDDADDFAVPAPDETTNNKDSSSSDQPNSETALLEQDHKSEETNNIPAPAFPNDGSFLEMMKRKIEESKPGDQ